VQSSAAQKATGMLATVISVAVLLFGASTVFAELKGALNSIWGVAVKPGRPFLTLLHDRFFSFSIVLAIGFLLLVSLVIDAALSAISSALWQPIQLLVSFAVVTVLFALIFRFLPDIHPQWSDVWFGAAFTSLLFVLGKFGLGLYLGKSAVGSSYGAAGSLVVMLVWIFWSANILFFGAEFTQVYARTHGSMSSAKEPEKVERRPEIPAYLAQPAYVAAAKRGGGGGAVKLAAGGVAGLFLGALAGGIGAALMVVKSVKKLIT
jgi:membrane protein